jgi:AAA+ ATPase superfamily predicted ATPase
LEVAVQWLHEPKELPDYWSDYLINTRTLQVSYLDEESARELIVPPVEDFTNIYDCAKRSAKGDRTAIDTIINLTRCQPLVQNYVEQVVLPSRSKNTYAQELGKQGEQGEQGDREIGNLLAGRE